MFILKYDVDFVKKQIPETIIDKITLYLQYKEADILTIWPYWITRLKA